MPVSVTESQEPTVSLTASSMSITPGSSVTLSWNSTNGIRASIDQGVGNVTPVDGGSVEVTPASTLTYEITVTGAAGTTPATDSVKITVLDEPEDDPPTIDSFSASDSSIDLGDSVTLNWTTTDATSVSIRVSVGGTSYTLSGLSVDGSDTVTPLISGNHSFQLRATNDEGTTTRSVSVTVNAPPDPPALPSIDSFSVTPTTIDFGDSVSIAWATTGADSVLVERGATVGFTFVYSTISTSLNGSIVYTPSSTHIRYRIRATNTAGTVSETRNITINPP